MCGCVITPGRTIVCDDCAAQMIECLNDQLPGDQDADLSGVFNSGEFAGMTSLVNGWLDGLQSQGEARR
jgi:hypothetical protein